MYNILKASSGGKGVVGTGDDLDVDGVSFKDAKNILTFHSGDDCAILPIC